MDDNKRTFGELSPASESHSPEHKRPDIERSVYSNMEAPVWFTSTMAQVNSRLDNLDIIKTEVKDIATTLGFISDEVADARKVSTAALQRVVVLENRLSESERVNALLRKDLVDTKTYATDLETYSRRSNLNIDGIVESGNESTQDSERKVLRMFKDKLNLDVENILIERCHRYGKPAAGKNRPIKIRFNWYKDREAVWAKRTMLKGSNIFIREDYPRDIEIKRRTLRPYLKAARDSHLYNKVFIRVDQLLIDGRAYDVDHLNALPQALKLFIEAPPPGVSTASRPSQQKSISTPNMSSSASPHQPLTAPLVNISPPPVAEVSQQHLTSTMTAEGLNQKSTAQVDAQQHFAEAQMADKQALENQGSERQSSEGPAYLQQSWHQTPERMPNAHARPPLSNRPPASNDDTVSPLGAIRQPSIPPRIKHRYNGRQPIPNQSSITSFLGNAVG